MKETRIEFDNGKRFLLVLLGLALAVLLAYWAYYMLFESRVIRIYVFLLVVVGVVFMAYMSLKRMYDMLFKADQTALVLNNKGILFNGTPLGRKVGFVEWGDVTAMYVDTTFGQKGVYLRLGNNKYYENISNSAMIKTLHDKGLPVMIGEMKIKNVNELDELISKYFKAYKENCAAE